jgi:hypothetical protein
MFAFWSNDTMMYHRTIRQEITAEKLVAGELSGSARHGTDADASDVRAGVYILLAGIRRAAIRPFRLAVSLRDVLPNANAYS